MIIFIFDFNSAEKVKWFDTMLCDQIVLYSWKFSNSLSLETISGESKG
jgi:hypothetical protein